MTYEEADRSSKREIAFAHARWPHFTKLAFNVAQTMLGGTNCSLSLKDAYLIVYKNKIGFHGNELTKVWVDRIRGTQ